MTLCGIMEIMSCQFPIGKSKVNGSKSIYNLREVIAL